MATPLNTLRCWQSDKSKVISTYRYLKEDVFCAAKINLTNATAGLQLNT